MWFQQRVEILEYHQIHVRSVSKSFAVPSVIRLRQYINLHGKRGVRLTRQNVFFRDGHQCQYCQKYFSKKDLTIDHVVPLSKGGAHSWENITTACNSCNNKKGNMSLEDYGRKPLNQPKQPMWLPQTQFKYRSRVIPDSWKPYLKVAEFL